MNELRAVVTAANRCLSILYVDIMTLTTCYNRNEAAGTRIRGAFTVGRFARDVARTRDGFTATT